MGIAIHNYSTSGREGHEVQVQGGVGDLAAAVRQDAGGILGTSARVGDLVSTFFRVCYENLMGHFGIRLWGTNGFFI